MPDKAKYYIGTSGWSYPKGEGTWKGHFYPTGKVDELEYYSRFFNSVEINSSFYRPPNPGSAFNWVRKTPDGFLFSVKLWQKFTHPKMYEQATGEDAVISQADVDTFKGSIEPLLKYHKLGVLLAQFPPSFRNTPYGKRVLESIAHIFGSYRLAVELRHHTWSDDPETANILRDSNVSWVHIDEPKFKTSVASVLPVTSDITYYRFHGRNAETWWSGDNETRYRYLYSPDEITGLTDRVRQTGEQAGMTFAFFNNHWQGYAPKNALDFMDALQLPLKGIPDLFRTSRLSDE